MCQLFGLSSNKRVEIQFSLREFRNRGKRNYHGWGFAFNQESDWKVIKEPYSLYNENIESRKFQFRSKIIIGHVRLASCGVQIHHNTHPFKIDKWAFAHNGTVNTIIGKPEFVLENYHPEGKTDSEYAFCYLLNKIYNESGKIVDTLQVEARKIAKYGHFNFLLSDGKNLFAHGDNSLYYIKRKAPFGLATLRDEQYSINLNEIKDTDEKAILIATEPLTKDETWQPIVGIKSFKDGEEFNVL